MKLYLKRQHFSYFLIFMVFALVRGIPEIQAGSLPIGWDPMNYYAPWTVAYLGHGLLNEHFLAAPPAIFILTIPLYSLIGDIWLSLKILGCALYGFLGASILFFARHYLRWDSKKSIICAVLLMCQPAALRVSWDLFKNELGLCLLFIQLPLISLAEKKSCKALTSLVIALSLLIVLSHQYVSIIYFTILVAIVLRNGKNRLFQKRVVLANVPAVVLFLVIFSIYAGWTLPLRSFQTGIDWFQESVHYVDLPAFSVLTNYTSRFGSYQNFALLTGKLFLLLYLFTIPLILFGFWNDQFLTPFFVFTIAGSFLPLLTPNFGIPDWDRWMFMLVYPIAFYSTNALWKLFGKRSEKCKFSLKSRMASKLSKHTARRIFAIIYAIFLISFGINYVIGTIPSFYEPVIGYVPLTMTAKPLSTEEAQDIVANVEWLDSLNLNCSTSVPTLTGTSATSDKPSACVICEFKDSGFIRLYLDEEMEVVTFNLDLGLALRFAENRSYSRVFMLLRTEPYINTFVPVHKMKHYSLFEPEGINHSSNPQNFKKGMEQQSKP